MPHSASLKNAAKPTRRFSLRWQWRSKAIALIAVSLLFCWQLQRHHSPKPIPESSSTLAPLVMDGGDPYVRALMRTISASEANEASPYTVLYGGTHVTDLSQHPEQCMPILVGPNKGNCSTAAGRYQFINTTWAEKAKQYHPHPSGMWMWTSYSLEPEFQDRVVYAWLSDPQAWNADIPALLKAGELTQVLRLLSGTWTSLGYGIENNSITPHLTQIYRQMLAEELKQSQPEAARSSLAIMGWSLE